MRSRRGYDTRSVRVAFLLKDLQLSGGVGVVVTHARNLATLGDHEVTLVTTRPRREPDWEYSHLPHLRTLPLEEAINERFDVAVSTWWETAYELFMLDAGRYSSFVQSVEDRFYEGYESVDRLGARVTLDLPVAFITEAAWIADTLTGLRPDAQVHLVRNGIDKETFPLAAEPPVARDGAPLRVIVEGDPAIWFKGVGDALEAVDAMSEPCELTLVCPNRLGLKPRHAAMAVGPLTGPEMAAAFSGSDVLLKLSRVEGMYGPPLEAFRCGATCVTTEVTGSEEYIRHGENALVCDWDDPGGTAAQLDMLARDRELLGRLRSGALATAAGWPDWPEASEAMARALEEIACSPPPEPYAGARELMLTLGAGIAKERGARGYYRKLRADAGRWQRVNSLPVVGSALSARRRLKSRLGRDEGSAGS